MEIWNCWKCGANVGIGIGIGIDKRSNWILDTPNLDLDVLWICFMGIPFKCFFFFFSFFFVSFSLFQIYNL